MGVPAGRDRIGIGVAVGDEVGSAGGEAGSDPIGTVAAVDGRELGRPPAHPVAKDTASPTTPMIRTRLLVDLRSARIGIGRRQTIVAL
jgi:hypothetical protein